MSFLLFGAVCLSLQAGLATPASPAPETAYAFVGVDVLDVRTGELSPNLTVIVDAGVVTRIGPAADVDIPPQCRRIDGRGRTLLPGLIDASVRVMDGAELALYLAHGVTTIRVFDGDSRTLELRAQVEDGGLLGPRMVVGSPRIEEATASRGLPALVERYARQGYDFLTVGGSLRPATYRELCDEARRSGIELAGPRPSRVTAAGSAGPFQNDIQRVDGLFEWAGGGPPPPIADSRLAEWFELLQTGDVTVTTALARYGRSIRAEREEASDERDAALHWIDPVTLQVWAARGPGLRAGGEPRTLSWLEKAMARQLELVASLHAAGIALLPGSDAMSPYLVPGLALHDELALWMDAGLEPMDALRAATWESARRLGLESSVELRPGAQADLLLVDGDPRTEPGILVRPAGVLAGGSWYSRSRLSQSLREVRELNEREAPFVAALLKPEPGLRGFFEAYDAGPRERPPRPPVRAELADRLCQLLLNTKDWDDAREFAEYCSRVWPEAAWAQVHLAKALGRQGERERPRRHALRALELSPGHAPAEQLLARLDAQEAKRERPGTTEGAARPAEPEQSPWSSFRGHNGSGVCLAERLPDELDPERNLLWRTPLPSGNSSPILCAGRVFLTAVRGVRIYTYCLDESDGEILWSVQAPVKLENPHKGVYSPATASPCSDGENVYVFFEETGLLSYDEQGEERWRLFLGPFLNVTVQASSPILAGDTLLLLCDHAGDSFLIAVDKDTGELRWRAERPGAGQSYSTPVLYRPAEGPAEVICSGPYEVVGYSLANGERLWWAGGMASVAKTVPLVEDDVLYVHSWTVSPRSIGADRFTVGWEEALVAYDRDGDGRISRDEASELGLAYAWEEYYDVNHDGALDEREWTMALAFRSSRVGFHAIRLGGRGDVSDSHVLWTVRKGLPNWASPLLYRRVLYLLKDGGVLTSLDPETGRIEKAGRIGSAEDMYFASPVAGDGKLYFASRGGRLTVVGVEADWEALTSYDLEEKIVATPVLSNGRVLVRTERALRCFGSNSR